jgi:acyl-CoA:acyl-CoA alkyltransferase
LTAAAFSLALLAYKVRRRLTGAKPCYGSQARHAARPAAVMHYESVHLEAITHLLPDREVSSEQIEARLAPFLDRIGLEGFSIEVLTGVRARRFWAPGTRPSALAARVASGAVEASGVPRDAFGAVLYTAMCRDFVEPATAALVHDALGLSPRCAVFDVSNACLGFANGMALAAGMIEREEIQAAVVVSAETAEVLVDATIRRLLEDPEAGRPHLQQSIASLTGGSGAVACVLTHRSISRRDRRLVGGVTRAGTQHHELCVATDGPYGPWMKTDAAGLMRAGDGVVTEAWRAFRDELDWRRDEIDRVVTHQVGVGPQRHILELLELDRAIDYATVETLGNMGSVSMPGSLSLALEAGFVGAGQRVAMLGVGSGINAVFLGLQC